MKKNFSDIILDYECEILINGKSVRPSFGDEIHHESGTILYVHNLIKHRYMGICVELHNGQVINTDMLQVYAHNGRYVPKHLKSSDSYIEQEHLDINDMFHGVIGRLYQTPYTDIDSLASYRLSMLTSSIFKKLYPVKSQKYSIDVYAERSMSTNNILVKLNAHSNVTNLDYSFFQEIDMSHFIYSRRGNNRVRFE